MKAARLCTLWVLGLSVLATFITEVSGQTNNLGQLFTGQPVVAMNDGTMGATALSSPVYFDVTQFTTSGHDWCEQVRKAYQKAISFNSNNNGTVLDARGFATGTTQFCLSQPFTTSSTQGAPTPVWLMMGPYTVITSVGWILPTQVHLITGTGDSTGQSGPNTLIQACNNNCSGNPNFPGNPGSPTLSFTWPHGPGGVFPPGTYSAILYAGAGNTSHGSTLDWSLDAFGGQIRDLALDCNGIANFAYFTANEEENSGIFNLTGRGCNATYGMGSIPKAGAFAFWDRASATNSIAGTSHFSADKINYKLGSVATIGGYGLVYESSKINLALNPSPGSCSTLPTAYPIVTGTSVTSAVITNAGTGCPGSLTCTISSNFGLGAMCTANVSGGHVSSISISNGGSGYDGTMHGVGPRAFSNWTFVGTSGGPLMAGGVLIEGAISPVVQDGHCEWFVGDCVQIGAGTAQTVGGVVRSINPSNATTATSVLHLGTNGPSQTMSTVAQDIDTGLGSTTPTTIQDDQHNVSLTPSNWPHVAYYAPGAMVSADSQAFTLLGHINNNITGSSGNKDNAGFCVIGVGTACPVIMFATAWASAPVCTASDQTHAAPLKVASSTTALTITGGTGSINGDVIAYQCQGNPN